MQSKRKLEKPYAGNFGFEGMNELDMCEPKLSIKGRINRLDRGQIASDLNTFGNAKIEGLLTPNECLELKKSYSQDGLFRSHIHMARHGFGKGEYKYFSYPLPNIVAELRSQIYPLLVPIANTWANAWNERMGIDTQFPDSHEDYISQCHEAGQLRPTPLLLQYGKGDFNCLHQDVYGDLLYPLQVAILLSKPNEDFVGGEFVLTEQRPRMQSRVEVVSLNQGDAIIFAVRNRPVRGVKRDYRVNMRHGVSRIHTGSRHTLGVIFHDAN